MGLAQIYEDINLGGGQVTPNTNIKHNKYIFIAKFYLKQYDIGTKSLNHT